MRVDRGEGAKGTVVPAQAQIPSPSVVPCEGEEPRIPVSSREPQTNDNCPLRHSPADCYIVRIRPSREGGDPLALWERAGVRVRKGMERNGTKRNRIKSFATLGHSSVVPVQTRTSHPCPIPNPPHAPGRSVRQRTSTRQLTVADMPENEYDDSNAAAKDPVPSPRRV